MIDNFSHEGTCNPFEALVNLVVHGSSYVFTAQGLPNSFMATFQLVSAKSGFTLNQGGVTKSVRSVSRYMYADGYDLRVGSRQQSPRSFWGRTTVCEPETAGPEPGAAGIPGLKREQMLALTHGPAGDPPTYCRPRYGWNPMAINLEAGWEALLADACGVPS